MTADNTDDVSNGKICITPDCGQPAKWKGLCPACYGGAKKLIDSEQTTWEELIEMGLAVDRASKFRAAFKAKKAALEKNPSDVTLVPGAGSEIT